MVANVERLLAEARKLKSEDRGALIDALHALEAPIDPEWQAAWLRECEDRLAALDRGEMATYDFDQVMADARALEARMKLRFAAPARRELNEAAIWLELQQSGLGERFLLEVAQARRLILDHPEA